MDSHFAPLIESRSREIRQEPTGDNFPTLEGLRAMAILLVVVHHSLYFNMTHRLGRVLYSVISGFWMGVPIFFILSGFLISYGVFKAGAKFNWRSYALRRITKIAPPFYLTSLIYATCYLVLHLQTPAELVVTVLASTSPLGEVIGTRDISPVVWSLYVEMQFYLTLPLVYVTARRFTRYPEYATFLVYLIVPRLVIWFCDAGSSLFPRILDHFSLGILFAAFLTQGHLKEPMKRSAPYLCWTGLTLLVVTFAVYSVLQLNQLHNPSFWWRFNTWGLLPDIATFLLLFSILLPTGAVIRRFLTLPVLFLVSLVSYEWYLLHPLRQLVALELGHANKSVFIYLCLTIFPMIVTFALACATYFWFSLPILHWAKARAKTYQ